MEKLLSKTFLWMFIGLLVTFATGYFVSINDNMVDAIFNGSLYWVFVILELVIVIFMSARIHKMSPTTAKVSFILYSFVSGLTFSSIFIAFEISSIIYVFLIAAIIFAIFGIIGYTTNIDLGRLSTYLYMGLIAIILCFIINIFLGSTTFDLILSIICILIFIGYTAYDIQKIKNMDNYGLNADTLAIYGALQLYLDFINIFLNLLSIFGNSKD